MRREGITGETWSVRMSTERLLTSLHVHSLMDIVQPAWLFPVFLPLNSPGSTLLPPTAHACHPNTCETEAEKLFRVWGHLGYMVRTTLARPIKEDLYSILFSNEIKQTTKQKMMQTDSEGRERLLQPNLLTWVQYPGTTEWKKIMDPYPCCLLISTQTMWHAHATHICTLAQVYVIKVNK